MDRCEEGPTLVVYPDGVWYTFIDEEDLDEITEWATNYIEEYNERNLGVEIILTRAYLDRIEEIDGQGPTLRSIIETNPDALAIADALDAERRRRLWEVSESLVASRVPVAV
mgnify:CR=1 FL=1